MHPSTLLLFGGYLVLTTLAAPEPLPRHASPPGPTPAPGLRERDDKIDCTMAIYKVITEAEKSGDPVPTITIPYEVSDMITETPSLVFEITINESDACQPPIFPSELGEFFSPMLSSHTAWLSRHMCELDSIYHQCSDVEQFSSQLAPSAFCTSLIEEAHETCEPRIESGAGKVRPVGASAWAFAATIGAIIVCRIAIACAGEI